MAKLANTTTIITGAGTGIGAAIAASFAAEGARLALVGRRREKLEEAAANLPADQILLCPCDVSQRPAVGSMVAQVEKHFGPSQILVNNAGTNTNPRSVASVDPDDFDRTVATNLTGVFNCTRAVLAGMRTSGGGIVITVSSIAGLRASKLAGAAYSAAKHGAVSLTNSINDEEVEHNIRACAICPGEVATPILEMRPEPVGPERRAAMLQAEDVADAALFVATLPARACIPLLVIKPTVQIFH